MIDTNLPIANQNPNDSYINAYTPPAMADVPTEPAMTAMPMPPSQNQVINTNPTAVTPVSPVAPVTPDASFSNQVEENSVDNSEKIEDQNIFTLLGVTDGTEAEREEFLDELQQVIWEDFLENDVDLLLTEDEKKQLDTMKANATSDPEKAQEEMVVYLEKLIPDLEEIMLEKALELKEDMVKERIAGLKEYFAGRQDKLDQLSQAEAHIAQSKWSTAAQLLNSMTD